MRFQAMRHWFASKAAHWFGLTRYQTMQPVRHHLGAERADLRSSRQRFHAMLLNVEPHPFAPHVIKSLCTSLTLCATACTPAKETIRIQGQSSNQWQVTMRSRSITMPTISGCLSLLQTAGVSLPDLWWEPSGSSLREILTAGHGATLVQDDQQMLVRPWDETMWIATFIHPARNRTHYISASLDSIEYMLKVPLESQSWSLVDPDCS